MKHRDEQFSPEIIEEQIERHLRIPDSSSATPDTHLIHALQHIARDDARRLERIRERLSEQYTCNDTKPQPDSRHLRLLSRPQQADQRLNKKQQGKQYLIKVLSGLVAALLIGSMLTIFQWQHQITSHQKTPVPSKTTPNLHGTAAFLMNATTGKVLVDFNGQARLPLANLTTIMTAVVAIENANLDQSVTIEQATLNEVPQSLPMALLQPGDQIPLRELLYGLLLPSGSDAAAAIAHAVAGNTQSFVAMMNEEARQLQLNNTHFSSLFPSAAQDQYTSAADVTYLTRYALQLSDFSQIISVQQHQVSATAHNHSYVWENSHTMRLDYPGLNVLQKGHDEQKRNYITFSADRDGTLLLGTEFGVPSEEILTSDMTRLLDLGFAG
ncbi:MAG: D-alanyl-D-alanine carboxypeptidase [Ktedonobacteraceae bacterium]|nr:D-alanyl-D-alanine carboxypeptidase [Ktedonobacteraceae bacterium]